MIFTVYNIVYHLHFVDRSNELDLLDLLLPVRLEAVELLVGIELLVVQAIPPRVLRRKTCLVQIG